MPQLIPRLCFGALGTPQEHVCFSSVGHSSISHISPVCSWVVHVVYVLGRSNTMGWVELSQQHPSDQRVWLLCCAATEGACCCDATCMLSEQCFCTKIGAALLLCAVSHAAFVCLSHVGNTTVVEPLGFVLCCCLCLTCRSY